ncbi:hypothetical protein FHR84_001765 [Actinopolyspora biskrensis]|uniref:Uncharacterized protein n=1 Tax=Actinopolyspora biskrensis TaxID=1470178 RepID=A0A852YWP0_9ACTN|nr:hypothetical protein [Actinopolyspora biskrensis]NYH78440.1 hypothetical protein [Actinopolyspora biskrensis]
MSGDGAGTGDERTISVSGGTPNATMNAGRVRNGIGSTAGAASTTPAEVLGEPHQDADADELWRCPGNRGWPSRAARRS